MSATCGMTFLIPIRIDELTNAVTSNEELVTLQHAVSVAFETFDKQGSTERSHPR